MLWIQKSYKDLREILMESNPSERRIVLGTTGIGKSLFTIFWICYLATVKEGKVVWRFAINEFYLLDFNEEVAIIWGPSMDI